MPGCYMESEPCGKEAAFQINGKWYCKDCAAWKKADLLSRRKVLILLEDIDAELAGFKGKGVRTGRKDAPPVATYQAELEAVWPHAG